jgi:hypothetical protein
MHQPALFHDSIFDALGTAVQAAGGVKRVAAALWPTLATEAACARLRGALNPEHAQKLCPLELVAIGRLARVAGDSSVMRYLAAEWGFAEPQPIEPEDQRAQLQREFVESVRKLEQIRTRLERVETTQIRSIR